MAHHVLLFWKILFTAGIAADVGRVGTFDNVDVGIWTTVESAFSIVVTPATDNRIYLGEHFHLVGRVVLCDRHVFRGADRFSTRCQEW